MSGKKLRRTAHLVSIGIHEPNFQCEVHASGRKINDACQTAGTMVSLQEVLCSVKECALKACEQKYGRAIDSLESFSCSWATGFAARCSA